MLAHRAAASALEASLKDEVAEEYERERASVNWTWPGAGSVYTSLNKDAVVVTDPAALLAWVEINYPEQVHTVKEIRPAWLTKNLLPSLEPNSSDEGGEKRLSPGERLPVIGAGGAIVPGVHWVKGGGLRSVSVKPDAAAEIRLNLAAAEYAAGRAIGMPELEQ